MQYFINILNRVILKTPFIIKGPEDQFKHETSGHASNHLKQLIQ